jgi:cell division protease FtsH
MPAERGYSEQTAQAIDAAVRALVDQAFATAIGILEDHRDVLERSAKLLLEKETLDEAQLKALFARA